MLMYFKTIRPKPGFLVDQAPNTNSFTGELFATVRPNGRILDESRFVIGRNDIINAAFVLGKQVDDHELSQFTVKMQKWPPPPPPGTWTSGEDYCPRCGRM
jgi:hypothetical protein